MIATLALPLLLAAQDSGGGAIPNECCPEPRVATHQLLTDMGWEEAPEIVDLGSRGTDVSLYGTASRDILMPEVLDGMHGMAKYYHGRVVVDMSFPFWEGSGADLTASAIPVPALSTAVLDGEKLQPRPGTMPGLYIYAPDEDDDNLYQYGGPVESGPSPGSTAVFEPPVSFGPSAPSSPVVYTNQLSGSQLWHFGDWLEVRHVDGTIARFASFDPYTSAQSGTLWRVSWVRDPYDNKANYAYDGGHRLISITFPSGLKQIFDYAPSWGNWTAGNSLLEVRYEQTSGSGTTSLTGQTWGLAFGAGGPSGGSHFGSRLVRTYSAPRRVLKDPSGSGPHAITGSSWVTGQIVHEFAYNASASVMTETQSVHVGTVFDAALQSPAGLSAMPVLATEYNSAAPRRVTKQTNSITLADWTLSYGAGTRTTDLLPGVIGLHAVTSTDAIGGQHRYEFDPATGQLYSLFITPSNNANGRPRAYDSTNNGIGGASGDVEPDSIEIYNIFDSTCDCQKPIERQLRSKLGSTTSTRTTQFEYYSDSKLLKKRTELNPATVPSPPSSTITWNYTYVRAMTGSQVWGAWLPLTEVTPDGTWDYVYSNWLDRTHAAQHGRIAGTATKRMLGVRLSAALDGSTQTTTTVSETLHRNLSNNPGSYAKIGPVNGQPRVIINGDGVTTEFRYTTNEGWLLDMIEHNGTVKRTYAHDPAGNTTSVTKNATAVSGLQAVTTFPNQGAFGVAYDAQATSGGVLRASEFYYDRFGHLAVVRQNNLSSTGVKPSRHGGSSANARDWVETQNIYRHHRIEHVYRDRGPLDEAAGPGQFLHTSYGYLANGRLSSVGNPNGSVTDFDFDGYGTLYRAVTSHSGASFAVTSPKSFINLFLEVTGSYEKAGSDHLWTLITRNTAGAITQLIEPKSTAPSGYTGATGEAKHQFEVDVSGRVVEARTYDGPSGSLLTKREMRYDQLGRQNWQNDHVLGFGSGNRYSVWRYELGKMSQIDSVERTDIAATSYAFAGATGLLSRITDGAGNYVDYTYYGNTTYVSDVTRTELEPGSGTHITTTAYEVDPFGRVTKIRDGGNLDHVYAFNSFGRVDRYMDPMGKVQKFLPDGLGRIVEHVRLDGSSGTIRNSSVFTDSGTSDGRTTVLRFDGLDNETIVHEDFAGRPFIVQNPGGSTTPTPASPNQSMCLYAEYDEASRIKAVFDGDGGKTVFHRDGPGRVVQRELAIHGQLISLWNTKEVLMRDAGGRLLQMNVYGSLSVTSGVPDHAHLVAIEQFDADSIGRTHAERYLFTVAPANVLEVNSNWSGGSGLRSGLGYYDNLGSGSTAPLSTTFGHDSIGRLTGVDWSGHTGATTVLADYGWVGRLRRDRTVRCSGNAYPESKTTYDYDTYSRLTQIKDDVYTASSTFTTKSQFEYEYDDGGNLRKAWYTKADGSVGDRFAYDEYDRLTDAWIGVTQATMAATSDPAGWVSGQMHAYLTYGLDGASNRTGTEAYTSSTPVSTVYERQDPAGGHLQGPSNRYGLVGGVDYEYDERGNLICDGVFIFRYDYLSRLQEVWKIQVEGDAAGDATYALVEPGAGEDARQDVQRGVAELRRRLPSEHMVRDFRARLRAPIRGGVVRVARGGGGMVQLSVEPADAVLHAVYSYDAFNRRVIGVIVGVETQFHTWDNWRQVVQYRLDQTPNPDAVVPTKQFVWGAGLDELLSYRRKNGSIWENYFLLHGGQDAAAKLVNSSGSVVETYEYDAYGRASVYVGSGTTPVQESSYGLPFLWKGIRLDGETGLLYMRNRHYSSSLGRFLTRDPFGNWYDGACFGNGYCYAADNPASRGDPLGLTSVSSDPTFSYGQLKNGIRLLRLIMGLTEAQEDWMCDEVQRGCIGLASAIAGTRVYGDNCWDTTEKAEAEAKRLAAKGGCDPVQYSVQFHDHEGGKDPEKPDVEIDPDTGRANMDNWDASYPEDGGNFNVGTFIGPNSVIYADHAHNPDADGDRVGDRMPDKEVAEMTAIVSSVEDFNAIKDTAGFNKQVWCVICKGEYK